MAQEQELKFGMEVLVRFGIFQIAMNFKSRAVSYFLIAVKSILHLSVIIENKTRSSRLK